MNETFDNLKPWRILEAIYRRKSITLASVELDISLSNASKLIGKLEKNLGTQLLKRKSRPIELTEYAIKLIPLIRDMILVADRLESVAKQLKVGRSTQTIVFSLSTTSIAPHVLRFINEFKAEYPGIEVELRTGLSHLDIKDGKADVVQMSYKPDYAELTKLPCGRCFNFMVASPVYLEKYGVPKTIDELVRHKLIFRRKDFYPECHALINRDKVFDLDRMELFTVDANGKKHIERKFSVDESSGFKKIYSSDYSSFASVMTAEGISVDLPASFIQDKLSEGTLVPVLPGWHREPWRKFIIFPAKTPEDSAVSIFAHWYQKRELEDSEKRWKTVFRKFGIPITD